MTFEAKREDGTLVVKLDGRIDGANAAELQHNLEGAIEETDNLLVVDLEQLEYISSAGLRVILLIAKALQRQNTAFAVCSLSEPIREVFEISGFDKLIPLYPSQAEAVATHRG